MANCTIETTKFQNGLAVTFINGNKGDLYEFHSNERVKRADVGWHQIVCSGEIEMIEKPADVGAWPIQRAGDDDKALPDILPGQYSRRCNADGTVYAIVCALQQDGTPPEPFSYETVKLKKGATFTLPKGAVMALGAGTVSAAGRTATGPVPLYAQSADVKFTCQTDVIGVKGWR